MTNELKQLITDYNALRDNDKALEELGKHFSSLDPDEQAELNDQQTQTQITMRRVADKIVDLLGATS